MVYQCPHCGVRVDCGERVGEVVCPKCRGRFVIPETATLKELPPAAWREPPQHIGGQGNRDAAPAPAAAIAARRWLWPAHVPIWALFVAFIAGMVTPRPSVQSMDTIHLVCLAVIGGAGILSVAAWRLLGTSTHHSRTRRRIQTIAGLAGVAGAAVLVVLAVGQIKEGNAYHREGTRLQLFDVRRAEQLIDRGETLQLIGGSLCWLAFLVSCVAVVLMCCGVLDVWGLLHDRNRQSTDTNARSPPLPDA